MIFKFNQFLFKQKKKKERKKEMLNNRKNLDKSGWFT